MISQSPQHYWVTKNSRPIVQPGHYDQTTIEFTMIKNAYSTTPGDIEVTIGNLKKAMVQMAAEVTLVKELLNALSPAEYHPDANRRKDSFGIARRAMLLDFDKKPDLNFIQAQLAPFFYLMWTTHSHMAPEKGARYRVYLPIDKSLSIEDWKTSYRERFKCYFERIGFIDNNTVDPSAYTFGQLAFMPGINPKVGHVELWFNDSADTEFFRVALLPELINQPPAPKQTGQTAQDTRKVYETVEWQPSSDDMDYLIRCLEKNNIVWSIPACPTSGDHGMNRKTIAAALQSIGASYSDFCQLDLVMQKGDTRTDSHRAWQDASKVNVKPHPGILLKLLTPFERKLCGLVR